MADFKIEIPIMLKGKDEGKRVGKDIGEKIASEIKGSLKGAGFSSKGPTGIGKIAEFAGISKGMGAIATKLGLIGAAVGAAVGLLAKASPYLKGILSIFGRAFMIFFRPFGDFLATLLRPLAILLMKMAIAFLKWTQGLKKSFGEGAENAPQIPEGTLSFGGKLGGAIEAVVNWLLRLGGALGQFLWDIGASLFGLGEKIGQWIWDYFIVPLFNVGTNIGQWVYDAIIVPLFSVGVLIGSFVYAAFVKAWEWTKTIGMVIWNNFIKPGWEFLKSVGLMIWENILLPAWNFLKDVGKWIWDIIKSPFIWLAEQIKSLWDYFKSLLGFGGSKENNPGNGMSEIQRTNMANTNNTNNKSFSFSPTYNITGNGNEENTDDILRSTNRDIIMQLKQVYNR